jgi:NDP-sugar pyrophosphorylase family protein
MHVIILAAGQSRRFQDAGYYIPKPFLEIEWRGTSIYMLQHVINTVPFEFNISVAVPTRNVFEIPRVKSYDIGDTKGPAETALRMIDILPPDSFLILDSDVLNSTNDLYRLSLLHCCGVLVCQSDNPSSSYVGKLGIFENIREKEQISKYAVQGAYFIHNSALDEYITQSKFVIEVKQEPYISHILDIMKCKKVALQTSYIPIEWGTPRDVRLSGARVITEQGG